MAALELRRGASSQLPAEITDGALYFTSDNNSLYIDYGAKRYKIPGIMTAADVGALPASTLYAGAAVAGGSAISAANLDGIDMAVSDAFETTWAERSCTV